MKTALVTGGAGFIGSHLVDGLVRRGYKVVVLDNFLTGVYENLKGLPVSIECGSVTDLGLVRRLVGQTDYVFHLAAITSVPWSMAHPEETRDTNVVGTDYVLSAASDAGVKKVAYASSSAVYGQSSLPLMEDMEPSPESPYGSTKLEGELIAQALAQCVCLRYFNVYGPRQRRESGAVIPRFIHNVLEGKPPVIYGDGMQTRDFVFVADVVAATIMMAENGVSGVFNIGSGETVTVNELLNSVVSVFGKPIQPEYRGVRRGDVLHSAPNITKAQSYGFFPSYSLMQGIEATVKEATC